MLQTSSLDESERKLLTEFSCLSEKANTFFQFLRELPVYCDDRTWEKNFGQTFDAYNRIWKFQQKYRSLLDAKCDLKRWQIGEIASKIGQLYHNYYTRTSDVSYLMEALSFYSAIRSRGYYSNAVQELKGDVMIKQLRYYARFIVICLLLKKFVLAKDLIKELNELVHEYVHIYGSKEDELEWAVIINEATQFLNADNYVSVVDTDNASIVLSQRMPTYGCISLNERGIDNGLRLNQAIIIGSKLHQVKFSELSLDMYWILQTLERESFQEMTKLMSQDSTSSSPPVLFQNIKKAYEIREHPRKCLLYKPTLENLFVHLGLSIKYQSATFVTLVYLSADGVCSTENEGLNGVLINSGTPDELITNGCLLEHHTVSCFSPDDFKSYLRRPYFIIVDSDNSRSFLALSSPFNQPLVILCSPVDTPTYLQDNDRYGSLFTLFLHSPLTAFCAISKINSLSLPIWDKCQVLIDGFSQEVTRFIVSSTRIDLWYKSCIHDDFLRLLICRFIFCGFVLRLHRQFQSSPVFLPTCQPPMNFDLIMDNPFLADFVSQLAHIMNIVTLLSLK